MKLFRKTEKENLQETILAEITEIKESVIKLNKNHQETAINVEEIQLLLEESSTNQMDVLNALIYVADYIDDFYLYAAKDKGSSLFIQAEMMLNGAVKKMSQIGLTRFYDNHTTFDVNTNTIEFTEENENFPDGHITRTLRCGYSYSGEIIRKSKVVAVKNPKRN